MITWANMKECSGKKGLIVKEAKSYPLAKRSDQVDSKIKDVGVVLHVQKEVYQSTLMFRS